jgi:CheY-like chemotaxis protein
LMRTERDKTASTDLFTGVKVLLVEDIKINRTLMTKVLEKHGCVVTSAVNGYEAIDQLQHQSFAIVFMDCQMPEMDGFEATRRIRASEPEGTRTVIVALTADAMTGDREKCLAAGMDDYLNKPFKREQITDILTKWVK